MQSCKAQIKELYPKQRIAVGYHQRGEWPRPHKTKRLPCKSRTASEPATSSADAAGPSWSCFSNSSPPPMPETPCCLCDWAPPFQTPFTPQVLPLIKTQKPNWKKWNFRSGHFRKTQKNVTFRSGNIPNWRKKWEIGLKPRKKQPRGTEEGMRERGLEKRVGSDNNSYIVLENDGW